MKTKRTLSAIAIAAMLIAAMCISAFAADAAVTTAEELKTALTAGGKVILGADILVNEMIEIPEETTATLDLAGYDITVGYQEGSETKHIYLVRNFGSFTLMDSSAEQTGSITARGLDNQGKMVIESGNVVMCDSDGGFAILNNHGGEVIMNGGLIESYNAQYNYAATSKENAKSFVVNGGTIKGGHGTLAISAGVAEINGGTFVVTGNESFTDNCLYVSSTGKLVVNDGTFVADGDTAAGGACVFDENGGAIINGGNFSNSSGGDVWGISGGTVINGGTFGDLRETAHVAVGATIVNGGVSLTKDANGKLINTPPSAEVSVLEPLTLTENEHNYMCWPSGDDRIDRPLEIVMNFKALEDEKEVLLSAYKNWKVDFYLTISGLANDSITADNCYLAGNYGSFGWIVIPTDGLVLEDDVTYPVVSGYDANITYKQICDSVKNFTAAIHIDEAILDANQDMKVTLELKMTNPDDANDVIVIGDPAIYEVEDLRAKEIEPSESFGTENKEVELGEVEENGVSYYRHAALATIDSLNYSSVGFVVTFENRTIKQTTDVVYKAIQSTDVETQEVTRYDASAFAGNGNYVFGQMIDFKADYLGKSFTYRPFATLFDGTVIYGEVSTATVGE